MGMVREQVLKYFRWYKNISEKFEILIIANLFNFIATSIVLDPKSVLPIGFRIQESLSNED